MQREPTTCSCPPKTMSRLAQLAGRLRVNMQALLLAGVMVSRRERELRLRALLCLLDWLCSKDRLVCRTHMPTVLARLRYPLPAPLTMDVCLRLDPPAYASLLSLLFIVVSYLQAVLSRYSGQEDVVVGVPTAGRDLPETQVGRIAVQSCVAVPVLLLVAVQLSG